VIAALTYLLGPVGWLIGLATRRGDPLVVYHARQSIVIDAIALGAPLVWAALAWLLTWIPAVGPIAAVLLFGLVVAAEIGMLVALAAGVVTALRGAIHMAPLVGSWAERLPIMPTAPASPQAVAAKPQE
jgi:uncharacterized membrane protein